MRVAFLGSQEIGARCLEVILDAGHEIAAVATFDPPAHETWKDDVARLAEERGLPRIKARRFRTRRAVEELRALEPEILFAIGWRWILPSAVLAIPPKGCLGIHGSLLPKLRGFAPVNWALIRDAKETGPTLFYFDEGTDTGDIVGQRPFPITDDDDAATVRARLADAAVALLEAHLPGLAAGSAPRLAQSGEGATYGPQRRPEDGQIDWSRSPREIFNWVRGLTRPYPGAFSFVDGRRAVIWKCRELDGRGPGPGRLVPEEVPAGSDEARDEGRSGGGDPDRGGDRGRILVGSGSGLVEILDGELSGEAGFERFAAVLRKSAAFDETPPASHDE